MLLTIYNNNNTPKATLSPADSSTQEKAIQSDNVLSLSFTLYEYIALDVNDYVDYLGERYWLTEDYQPQEKSTQEWVYNVKLYGIESLIKRFLVLHPTEGDPIFTLTAPPREHVALVVASINAGMGNTDWKVGSVEGTDNIVVDYEGLYCDEALKKIASQSDVKVEWWVEGQTVNLCRCEHGEEIVLGYNKGLAGLERDTADNVKFYTRLFPIGSSRNIDPQKYGHSRLQLPGGAKYVDINTEKYGIIHHFEKNAFADIYPRRIGMVSSVRSEEVAGEDGKPFVIWYFKDDAMNFDPNDYEIGGLIKRVSFQEGELAGLGTGDEHYFEVNFNSETREFEIITIWPYGNDEQLPGGLLIPKEGDRYILWNLRMPDEWYPLAEAEYLEAVNKFNARHAIDVSVYKGPTDYVYLEDNGIDLFVGRRVRLESNEFFPQIGYRLSRITKITRKVNLPSQMDIEISDALSCGFMEKVEDSISETKNYVKTSTIALPDLIRSGDDTRPTDNNLFSARRTIQEFVSRLKDDIVSGSLTLLKDIIVKGVSKLQETWFGTFVKGSTGAGIYKDEQENWHIEGDYFHIRKKLTAEDVEIQHTSHIGGKLMNTSAGMLCIKVEEFADYWRCYFKLEDAEGRKLYNQFRIDDQGYVETFNLVKQADGTTGNHFLWRKVVGFGEDYIDLSKSDCAESSDAPFAGDFIVQLGNRTDPTRQGAIIDASAGSGAPYIRIYKGINSYTLPKPVIDLNTEQSEICAKFISSATGKDYDKVIDTLQKEFDLVKKQTDKELTLWFYDHNPTLTNLPALEWTTDELKEMHEQDMFYNISDIPNEGGRAWRFEKNEDGTYSWNDITDQQTIKALENAAKAQDTADGKRRIFVEQPTDSQTYDVGDLWVNATYGSYKNDELVCIQAKAAGEAFSITHWKPTSTATTAYLENLGDRIITAVTDSEEGIEAAKKLANQGINDAYDAWRKALEALGIAEDANEMASVNTTVIQQTKDSIAALANKISFDSSGNVTNINTSGLVTTADFNELLSKKVAFDSNGNVTNINTSGLMTTVDFNELLSEKVTFDSIGNVTNISTSGLVTTVDFNELLSKKVMFDSNGNVTNISTSGLVTTDHFAQLFSQYAEADGYVKRAEISTFITKDEAGQLISSATIFADQIKLEGAVSANGTFTIDKEGYFRCSGGEVGGFSVGSSSFESISGSNSMLLSASVVRFLGGYSSVFIGAETMPASNGGSFSTPVRIEVDRSISSKSYGNAGLYLSVQGAKSYDDAGYQFTGNHALYIPKGNVCGLRLRTRRVEVSQTLSLMDTVIYVIASSTIILTLPPDPEDGQFYLIRNFGSGSSVTIKANKDQKIYASKTGGKTDDYTDHAGMQIYIYDAVNKAWLNGWFNAA